jgi:hypothetical protein
VNAAAAFGGYAAVDAKANCDREAYLSAFCYGEDFRARADDWGFVDTKGYDGICCSPWVWFDIDREGDLQCALIDARRLTATLSDRFRGGNDALIVFYSGAKGFHVGLSTALWVPEPSAKFHRVARQFAETIAETADVTVDTGIYNKVRAFRAPNSRHPKTGLFKRRLTLHELNNCLLDDVLQLAREPAAFNLFVPTSRSDRAAADWHTAIEYVERQTEAHAQRRAAHDGTTRLNRQTFDFIVKGADEGERHRLLFSAAANLAEFGCPPALAHALLSEAALDSGLRPADVRRQIDCGLATGARGGNHHD